MHDQIAQTKIHIHTCTHTHTDSQVKVAIIQSHMCYMDYGSQCPIGFLLAIGCCDGAVAPKGPMTYGTTADGFGGQLGGWGPARKLGASWLD